MEGAPVLLLGSHHITSPEPSAGQPGAAAWIRESNENPGAPMDVWNAGVSLLEQEHPRDLSPAPRAGAAALGVSLSPLRALVGSLRSLS